MFPNQSFGALLDVWNIFGSRLSTRAGVSDFDECHPVAEDQELDQDLGIRFCTKSWIVQYEPDTASGCQKELQYL